MLKQRWTAIIPSHVWSRGRRLIVTGTAMVALASCGRESPDRESERTTPEVIDVRLTPVIVAPAERTVELTGTLYGEEEVTVAARVPGRVVALHADLGDIVEPGGRLAQVDPVDYELAVGEARSAWLAVLARLGLRELPEGDVDLSSLPVVAQARAEAANARARLDRARKLYERSPPLIAEQEYADFVTQSEVASAQVRNEELNAQAQLAEARVRRAALDVAKKRLGDAAVSAPSELPIRYRVAERQVAVGEFVAAGDAMFRLVASDRVKFRGSLPERFVGQVAIGAPATLFAASYSDGFAATVTRVSPAIDPTNRTFGVEIEADNPEGRLKPGGFLRASVRAGIDERARFVPAAMVVEFTGAQRVYIVRNGKVNELRVQTGARRGEMIEVVDLPDEVDAVIDISKQRVSPGASVRVVE